MAEIENGTVAPVSTTDVVDTAPVAEVQAASPAPAEKAETVEAPRRKRAVVAKVVAAKAAPAKEKSVNKTAGKKKPATEKKPVQRRAARKAPVAQKETVKMATKNKTPEFAAAFQESFKDAGEKAKAVFGDAGEFAKGNLEAVAASGRILANGVKAMGEAYVAETRSAYETATADIKQLAAVKSPVEFFELQSKLFRKNFDAAVATGSKKSEEALKLANEAFQPLSTRISLAMEKFKRAA